MNGSYWDSMFSQAAEAAVHHVWAGIQNPIEMNIMSPTHDAALRQTNGLQMGGAPRPDLPPRPILLQLTRMFEDVANAVEEQLRGGQ